MYEIDELANIVAMANEHEQLALTEDIRKNGQQEPAVLWRGKIVDGRCRQLACIALDVELSTRELDNRLSREEVAEIVKSLNTRRNLTDTQKCMSAYKAQEKQWETNEEIARKWGIPLGTYKNARYMAMNAPELVDDLFNGKSVSVYDPDKNQVVTTSRINTLARIVKRNKERTTVVVDDSEKVHMQWTADGIIKTEAGKEWYYGKMKAHGIREDAIGIRMDYVELANLKFKVNDATNE